jgi:t-SNARE complex subunit (syntaxin)
MEQKHEQPDKRLVYEQLEKEVIQLRDSMAVLNYLVKNDQEPLDTLEDFIHMSKEEVKEAHHDLMESTEYSRATHTMYYIMGGIASLILYVIL